MRKFQVYFVLTGAALWMTGCGMQFGSSSPKGGLAVVDLDKVAAETGKNLSMKDDLTTQESSVRQQLQAVAKSAEDQFKSKQEEFGESPTEEQQKELNVFRVKAVNALNNLKNQAGQALGQYRQDQVAKFRAEIKPIALEVAAKRKLSVVIPKNEGLLLAVDPGVDITEDVIKAYREKRPTAPTQPTTAAQQSSPTPQQKSANAPKTEGAQSASASRTASSSNEKRTEPPARE
ncbi:MAG: OmpH family outer membrane protein [Planctomycetes bacterium]|nr:OmpH family outer membrane protein [Planctomycetota bacterium]